MRKKLTIAEMHKIAEARGGKCLSSEYVNNSTKLEWECVRGHQWEAVPNSIKQGSWCPVCGRERTNQTMEAKKLTMGEMQKIAASKGGIFLSKIYKGVKYKHSWECSVGHQWEATPDNIKRGRWCPKCVGKNATIADMQAIAEAKGGRCLSSEYVKSQTKLQWECAEGHQWEAVPNSIKQGRWCPKCGDISMAQKQKLTIEEMQVIAESRGGKCLSSEYVSAHTKLQWECAEGHQWAATPAHIKTGTWCPDCGRDRTNQALEGIKLTLEEMQKLAEERGGKCLSSKYVNIDTKLQWQCSAGHHWEATPNKIKQGRWCPQCRNFSERICREAFKQIFGTDFKPCWPDWLVNEEGNRMELDGYSPTLKLAFEHQGSQHFEITYYTPTPEKLDAIRRRDQKKKELCEKKGITLIEVGYLLGMFRPNDTQFNDQIKNYIGGLCRDKGVTLPENFETLSLDLFKAYQPKLLEEIQAIAEKKGGQCLSDYYMGSATPLEFECSAGHRWGATPGKIKQGTWCPVCAGNRKGTIEGMRAIAKERGGNCLSKKYLGAHKKLLWQCSAGHQWEATPDTIKQGRWCPKCGIISRTEKRKGTIEEMHIIAEAKGGKCFSIDYVNAHTKLQWKCAKGHQWEATPHSIKRGRWCPMCAKNRRKKATVGRKQKPIPSPQQLSFF